MKSILIIGVGRFGYHLARRFHALGDEVMIIDRDEASLQPLLSLVDEAQVGDCRREDVLRSLGVPDFDICFVCTGEQFQSSLEITLLLKELGAKKVVSQCASEIQEKFLLRNGADEVYHPERDLAEKLAVKYSANNLYDYFSISADSGVRKRRLQPAVRVSTETGKRRLTGEFTELLKTDTAIFFGSIQNGRIVMTLQPGDRSPSRTKRNRFKDRARHDRFRRLNRRGTRTTPAQKCQLELLRRPAPRNRRGLHVRELPAPQLLNFGDTPAFGRHECPVFLNHRLAIEHGAKLRFWSDRRHFRRLIRLRCGCRHLRRRALGGGRCCRRRVLRLRRRFFLRRFNRRVRHFVRRNRKRFFHIIRPFFSLSVNRGRRVFVGPLVHK